MDAVRIGFFTSLPGGVAGAPSIATFEIVTARQAAEKTLLSVERPMRLDAHLRDSAGPPSAQRPRYY